MPKVKKIVFNSLPLNYNIEDELINATNPSDFAGARHLPPAHEETGILQYFRAGKEADGYALTRTIGRKTPKCIFGAYHPAVSGRHDDTAD